MPKTEPRYTVQRSLKIRPETYTNLILVADREHMKYGKLLRIIVESWLKEYMDRSERFL